MEEVRDPARDTAVRFLATGGVRREFEPDAGVGLQPWRGLTVGVVVWFVIDSSLSVATGFWLNAVSNSVLLIGYLIPLMRTGVLSR